MTYQKRTKGVKIGLCICRYDPHQSQDPNQDPKKKENPVKGKVISPNKTATPHIDK